MNAITSSALPVAETPRWNFQESFRLCAQSFVKALGSHWAFVFSLVIVAGWLVSGPVFHFSDTWQLAINTCTSVITFLMVFLLQYSQNRDTKTLHLKLDALIRSSQAAEPRAIERSAALR